MSSAHTHNGTCPGECLFAPLPQCPAVLSAALPYPSVFFTFALTAVASLGFLLVVACKYNSVRVFDHKIRTPSISNTLWIVFYLFIFLESVLQAVRFAVAAVSLDPDVDWWFEGVSWTLHGVATFALCATLNHQRRFRSAASFSDEHAETDPLLKRYSQLRRTLSWLDVGLLVLLIVYVVLAWVQLEHVVVKWYFFTAYLVQRLPALFLTMVIVFYPKRPAISPGSGTVTDEPSSNAEGPTRKAKLVLLLATLLCVSGDAPLSLWSLAFGQGCVFWLASWVDLLHVIYIVGLVCYFLFVRYEYLRLMEEAIWSNVSTFTSTFNFSKF